MMPTYADPNAQFSASVSPLEARVQELFGLQPGLNRATLLPFAGSGREGNLEFAAPQFLYDLAKAFATPGLAMQGYQVTPEESLNVAANVMGGGLGVSHAAGPVGEGILGMAVKQKGGNWLDDTITDLLRPLKRAEAPTAAEAAARAEPVTVRAVNNWIDKQLTRYVKNEMGTPEDPVRALAERGILHLNPERGMVPSDEVEWMRTHGGLPPEGLGKSELARNWEMASDALIYPFKAGKLAAGYNLKQNPWLAKLPPESPVYTTQSGLSQVGFPHLIDELGNAVHPDSGLPRNLQLNPESLQRMGVAQAVEHVAKINKWRAEQKAASDLEIANNSATQVFKEYPTIPGTGGQTNTRGMRWVQIKDPGAVGSPDDLKKALKYEGDVMGHCVGGYCEDVKSGRSMIYSLRDVKGEPHVTIEVGPNEFTSPFALYDRRSDLIDAVLDKLDPPDVAEFENRTGVPVDEFADEWASNIDRHIDPGDSAEMGLDLLSQISPKAHARVLEDIAQSSPSPVIVQIKGKQNKDPKDEYLPFIADFIRGGNWSDIYEVPKGIHQLPDNTVATSQELNAALDAMTESPELRKSLTPEWLVEQSTKMPPSEWLKIKAYLDEVSK